MADIKIYGKLVNATTDNIIAGADQIYDSNQSKFQSKINEENKNNIANIQQNIGNEDSGILKSISDLQSDLNEHTENKNNPHEVSKEQVGLGNVDNTSDIDKPVSNAVSLELKKKVDKEDGKSLVLDTLITALEQLSSSSLVKIEEDQHGNPAVLLPEGTKLTVYHKDGTFQTLIFFGEYEDGGKQTEVGASNTHLNLNTDDTVTVDTPNGKKVIAYVEDVASKENLLEHINDKTKHLPQVEGVNKRLVTDFDGEVIWESREEELLDIYSYGVLIDTIIADPELTRVGNPLLHKSLPIQSNYRGCIAKDGEIKYYLDPDNWKYKLGGNPDKGETEQLAVLDGTDGDVMVHIPRFYGCSKIISDTQYEVRISTSKLGDNWTEIPEMLITAYKTCLDRTNNKACSVVNNSIQYRGGNNNTTYETETPFRTLLGKPLTATTRTNFRTYCSNAGLEPLCYEYYKWVIYWAFVIEYANLNSQSPYNSELTSDGYHQGGLGNGVTNVNSTKWDMFNSYYPLIPCGYTNEIGNHTGVKEAVIGDFAYTSVQTTTITSYSKTSSNGTAINTEDGKVNITEAIKSNARILSATCKIQSGSTTYNIEGLDEGQSIIFYTNSSQVAEATSNGEIVVDWGNAFSNREIRASFAGICNITISIVSASATDLNITMEAVSVPRYRGIEQPFGDIETILDGIVLQRSVANEASSVYVQTSDFTDNLDDKQIVGTEIAQDGYIKAYNIGTNADIIPSAVGGNSNTYMCDYHYCNASYTGARLLLVGGSAHDVSSAGPAFFYSGYSVGFSASNLGFRSIKKL